MNPFEFVLAIVSIVTDDRYNLDKEIKDLGS